MKRKKDRKTKKSVSLLANLLLFSTLFCGVATAKGEDWARGKSSGFRLKTPPIAT
jgi:hypothetical protein